EADRRARSPRERTRGLPPIPAPRRRHRRACRGRRRRRGHAIVPSRARRTRSRRPPSGAHLTPLLLGRRVCERARYASRRRAARRVALCPVRTLAPESRRPYRSFGTPQRTPEVETHVNAYATGRGTGVFRGSHRVTPTAALRGERGDRGRAPHPTARPSDPRQQPHLVPRPARTRVPRRPAPPPSAFPDQGRAVWQEAARLPVAPGPS